MRVHFLNLRTKIIPKIKIGYISKVVIIMNLNKKAYLFSRKLM